MTDNAGALFESSIPGYPLIGRGKVRDIYSIDDEHLLIVTTDRLSAFDVVMPDPVPGKGEVLTQISLYWFRMMEEIIENQLTSRSIDEVIEDPLLREQLRRRSLVVKRLKPLPIEAVARGYLIGSGWKDYRESGEICGIPLPPGLRQAERRINRRTPRLAGTGCLHPDLRSGCGARPAAWHYHRRHQVRVRSGSRRPLVPYRRSAYA
jgi:phosphoribosylaminoimidazole-succinocarboxamide synthase